MIILAIKTKQDNIVSFCDNITNYISMAYKYF